MQVCDFTRSFCQFRIDLDEQAAITLSHKPPTRMNHARIALECRCVITHADGHRTDCVLGASCKTERVAVNQDIWLQPNADFSPVVSDDDFLLIKSWDRNDKGIKLHPPTLGDQPERQVGKANEAWSLHQIDLEMNEGRLLETTEQIIESAYARHALVSQTEFNMQGAHVWLEYPVKTVSVNEREGYYQVDTGPVLIPDPSIGHPVPIGNLRLAYVAHNAPDWAEFIVNVPVPLAKRISVNHYSRAQRVKAKNAMIEVV